MYMCYIKIVLQYSIWLNVLTFHHWKLDLKITRGSMQRGWVKGQVGRSNWKAITLRNIKKPPKNGTARLQWFSVLP